LFVVREDRIEAGAGGGAAVLRVLGEDDAALRCVPAKERMLVEVRFIIARHLLLDLVQRRLRQRRHVPKPDVVLVRRRFRRNLVQLLAQKLALDIRPLQDRRPAANLIVLLLHFGRTSLCNPWSQL
jgi:hypothetical protein